MIASLPMYWRPETAAYWREFWSHLRAALPGLPELTEPDDIADLHAHWLRPDLVLSMTCGLPFRSFLKGRVTYIGTLDFGLDAAPGHYFSVVIARPWATTRRLAYNSADSQSGWAATQHAPPFDARPVFDGLVETGSHAASLAAVAEGRADIAYIDAVTWRLLEHFDPNAPNVHVAGRSIATPGLPLIAAKGVDPEALRRAIAAVVATFRPADPLAIAAPRGFHVFPETAYHAVPIPAPPA